MRSMDETQNRTSRQCDTETNILSRIVDAMLAVQTDLQDATVEEWTRTLVASCRQRKGSASDQHASMTSTC